MLGSINGLTTLSGVLKASGKLRGVIATIVIVRGPSMGVIIEQEVKGVQLESSDIKVKIE